MPNTRVAINIAGSSMDSFVAEPGGTGPHPGVVVIMHAPGLDSFVEEMTRRLRDEGYVAIAPQLYHRQNLGSNETGLARMGLLLDTEVIADVGACVEYLQERGDVSEAVGVVGFCMGGRIAFMVAAANPTFRAAVPFYGGNTEASWGNGPTVMDRLGNTGCPVLGFFGGKDTNPSPEMMRALSEELTRLGKVHDFRDFPEAGHGYMNFNNPERYDEAASKTSWELTVTFLAEHLKGQT